MAFTLSLTDLYETVNFLDGTTYEVANGGFDIGMPKKVRELTEIRPGFWKLIKEQSQYREATITLAVHGSTRTAVIAAINKIERIIASINGELIGDYIRGQLSYAWDGASGTTYFEVYAGDVILPSDVLSVEKVHAVDDAGYYVPEISVKLYMSPVGYGYSIHGQTPAAIQIFNSGTGKTTSGITICGFHATV